MKVYRSKIVRELESNPISKGEMFNNFPATYDYAVPQNWLDAFAEFCKEKYPKVTYHLILSSTVWVYGYENKYTGPVTCCCEVKIAFDAWEKS